MNKPNLHAVGDDGKKTSKLDQFRSKRDPALAAVEKLETGLPVLKIAEANDFVRIHPDEESYWSGELCFVNVPIKGQKKDTLHLISEDIALSFVAPGKVKRFRLALASKPYDVFFLCIVPTQNPDNSYNRTVLRAVQEAKSRWVQVTSLKETGVEDYKIGYARDADAFPRPAWLKQELDDLIISHFHGRQIDCEDHPGLIRLLGARPDVS